MSNLMKTLGVAAIMMISCLTTVCIVPDDGVSAEPRDMSDATYWGFEREINSISDILPEINESIPGANIQTVEDLEDYLENMAEMMNLDSDDVDLEKLNVVGEGYMRGKRIDNNTLTTLGGASGIITLNMEAPVELIKKLARGDDYIPSTNEDEIKVQLKIVVDRYQEGAVHLNNLKEVISYTSFSERAIHITGLTNVSVQNNELVYGEDAIYAVDHLMASTVTSEVHFESKGFKFIPENNEKGWEIDTTGFVSETETIHNEATGTSADALDMIAEFLQNMNIPMVINHDTHSGVVSQIHGIESFNYTATVDRTGNTPVVEFTNNSPDAILPSWPFFEPFEILFSNGELLINLSKIFNESMMMDAVKAQSVKSKILACKDRCEGQFSNIMINIYFVENEEDIHTEKSLDHRFIKFGSSFDLDVKAPAKEGMVFTGWRIAQSDLILWDTTSVGYCDMYLIASYAIKTLSPPTKSDYDKSPGSPLVWFHDVDDDKAIIDGYLLTSHTVPIYVVGQKNGENVYVWTIDPEGTEVGVEDVDTTLKVSKAPKYAKNIIENRAHVYIEADIGDNIPDNTIIYYDVGDMFENGTSLDIYIDNGFEILFAGNNVVKDGKIPIHGERTKGFLIADSDNQPAPIVPDPRGDNTPLIIGAAIATIVIAIIAYIALRKDN